MRAVHTRRKLLTVTIGALLVIGPASVAAAAALDVPIVRPGPGQVAILDAPPGADVRLLVGGDAVIAEGDVDLAGSLLFRNVEPGSYTVELEDAGDFTMTDVEVPGFDEPPPREFFDEQQIDPGYGYVTVRDGTTLSVNVVLPGDVADGPFPTVVEYSAYDPSDPTGTGVGLASLATALGYAWVGVNMRGSGCSGGSFDYFEPIQATDGYDAIEAIAAQPWVQGNEVGMVGVSYPGISQLYVAAEQPPSLLAITPLSVVDSSALYTLYPGGILNDGFALQWALERDAETAPFGQQWSQTLIDNGDEICRENQLMRLQNPALEAQIRENPYYSDVAVKTDVRPLLADIEVPVLLAGAWQDEQTGGHFANMLDGFTGTDHFYASLTNGLHTESLSAGIAPRWLEFLELYVAKRVPSLDTLRTIAPVLGEAIWETDQITLRDDRFAGATYDEALATFEADAPIEVIFEEGAGGAVPLAPMPAWSRSFPSWPIPGAAATYWYLGPDGSLGSSTSVEPRSTSYVADPESVPEGYFDEATGGNIWSVDATFDWVAQPTGTAASFLSDSFTRDTIVMGSGSADLWIAADAPDTDVEVTITEVRTDGTEVLVQSGWLRASHRALDEAASTALHPVQTHLEDDAAPLPVGEFVPIRVDIYPFAHPFRVGSQLRVTVDAPGGNRQIWHWDTISDGETVTIAHDTEHPSRIVLSTLSGIDIPDQLPACGTLRGQPCRDYP
jgi:predicted acyl esterase